MVVHRLATDTSIPDAQRRCGPRRLVVNSGYRASAAGAATAAGRTLEAGITGGRRRLSHGEAGQELLHVGGAALLAGGRSARAALLQHFHHVPTLRALVLENRHRTPLGEIDPPPRPARCGVSCTTLCLGLRFGPYRVHIGGDIGHSRLPESTSPGGRNQAPMRRGAADVFGNPTSDGPAKGPSNAPDRRNPRCRREPHSGCPTRSRCRPAAIVSRPARNRAGPCGHRR